MTTKRKINVNSPVFRPYLLEARDIRIGNYLLDGRNEIIRVTIENIQEVLSHLYSFQPVRISETLLLASGFKQRPDEEYIYDLDRLDKYFMIFTGKIGMLHKTGFGHIGYPTRYVHHLQNIYYVVTGNELELAIE